MKHSDLNGQKATINYTALLRLATIARWRSQLEIEDRLREAQRSNGKAMPTVYAESFTRAVQDFELSNELLHTIQEAEGREEFVIERAK